MGRASRRASRHRLDRLERAYLALIVVLAAVHLYLGLLAPFVPADRTGSFALVGLSFVAGAVAYATRNWRPLFYLVGALFAAYLGTLWLFEGANLFRIGVATGVVGTAFTVLGLFLFARDASAERDRKAR